MKLKEVRLNQHQTHMEDLVLLGEEGINEFNDKIDRFKRSLEGEDSGLNTTTKIDGCLHPGTIIKTSEGDLPIIKLIEDYNNFGKIYTGYGKDDQTGEIKEVSLNFPRVLNGNKDWCTIEFDNNSFITCTVDHPFKDGCQYTEAYKLSNESKIDII